MNFNIIPLDESHYDEVLVGWWKDWKWVPPLKDFLPDNGKGGLIIYDDKTPVCAGFIYMTNSKVAWIDWIISNKDYKKKPNRQQAISLLIHTLTQIAKNADNVFAYALIKHKGLIGVYEQEGYIAGDQYTKEMIKKL
jgi:hypothetical protein